MRFLDTYKIIEKLCNQMYGTQNGVTEYINEMIDITNGAYYVSNWNYDLKNLKHCRWIRNKIAHEPGYTEENMCEDSDIQFLEDFYSRLLSRNDPISNYRRATVPRPKKSNTAYPQHNRNDDNPHWTLDKGNRGNYNSNNHKPSFDIDVWIGIVFAIACIVCIAMLLFYY